MIRDLGFLKTNNHDQEEEYVNRCPICKLGNGALCKEHACKDFDWIREYINKLEEYDETTIYILSSYISKRISLVINELKIVNGRIDIEGYLKKDDIYCSEYMERILKEILSLERAKKRVITEIEKEKNRRNLNANT